jgi:hypothetical protein
MFQLTEANVSCSSPSVVATYEHANSTLSSAHLQLIGRARSPMLAAIGTTRGKYGDIT